MILSHINGYPDFSEWSEASFEIVGLTGNNSKDFSLVYKKMIKDWGFKTQKEVQDFLKSNKLTLHHHQDGKTIQLVPSDLHNNIPHAGRASNLRNQ